ncbi:MAG: aminomethyltransferase family protein [Proteobacteria bacterium]|nr:aminomethyltransferase family protein [Pseudomonadota bacterium]
MTTASQIRATPFHGRAAMRNPCNRWTERNGSTLALDYGDAQAEALAARTNVVLADISWRWRVFLDGDLAGDCLDRLMTRRVSPLTPGQSLKALWLNDGGGVRGAGVIARYARDRFLLVSAATDAAWIVEAARQSGVSVRDATEQEGGLALIGPYAEAVLKATGLAVEVAPLGFQKLFWRGLDVTVSRWGEQKGYEIWCKADDCFALWDRLMRGGAPFGIRPGGLAAMDVLDVETGIPRPARDYLPATDGFACNPTPSALGLESLIDEKHISFNGRGAWLANRGKSQTTIVGVEIDSETPAPFATLVHLGRSAGCTLTSVCSPFLRRALALAQVEKVAAAPGTEFMLSSPLSLGSQEHRTVAARVVSLPFVEAPDPIAS